MHTFVKYPAHPSWKAGRLNCDIKLRKRTQWRAHAEHSEGLDAEDHKSQFQGLKAAFQLITEHLEFGFDLRAQQRKSVVASEPKSSVVRWCSALCNA